MNKVVLVFFMKGEFFRNLIGIFDVNVWFI